MKTKLLMTTLLAAQIGIARANEGGKEGHGAGGILHKGQVYLLDFVENGISAKAYFKNPADFSPALADHLNDALDLEQLDTKLVAAKLREIYNVSPGLAFYLLREIEMHAWSLAGFPEDNPDKDTRLNNVADDNSMIDLTSEPKVQIAFRDDDDKSVSISAKAWGLMDMSQKVGTLFHEVACSYLSTTYTDRDWVTPDKKDCKRMTALLFEKKFYANPALAKTLVGNDGLLSLISNGVAVDGDHDRLYTNVAPFNTADLELSISVTDLPTVQNHEYSAKSFSITGENATQLMAKLREHLSVSKGMLLADFKSKTKIPIGDYCEVKRKDWDGQHYNRDAGFYQEHYSQLTTECHGPWSSDNYGHDTTPNLSDWRSVTVVPASLDFTSFDPRNLCGAPGCMGLNPIEGVLHDRYLALISGVDPYFQGTTATFVNAVAAAAEQTVRNAQQVFDSAHQTLVMLKDLF